jgi:hypothetical protein
LIIGAQHKLVSVTHPPSADGVYRE